MRRSIVRVAKLALLAATLSLGMAAGPAQAQGRFGVFDIHCLGHAFGTVQVVITYSNGHIQRIANSCNTPDGHGLYPWPEVAEPLADIDRIRVSIRVADMANSLYHNSCTATSANEFLNANCLADENDIAQITTLISIPKVQ